VKSKVDNGVDGHRALQHLLGVVDEHHGGGVSPIAPAKSRDCSRLSSSSSADSEAVVVVAVSRVDRLLPALSPDGSASASGFEPLARPMPSMSLSWLASGSSS